MISCVLYHEGFHGQARKKLRAESYRAMRGVSFKGRGRYRAYIRIVGYSNTYSTFENFFQYSNTIFDLKISILVVTIRSLVPVFGGVFICSYGFFFVVRWVFSDTFLHKFVFQFPEIQHEGRRAVGSAQDLHLCILGSIPGAHNFVLNCIFHNFVFLFLSHSSKTSLMDIAIICDLRSLNLSISTHFDKFRRSTSTKMHLGNGKFDG